MRIFKTKWFDRFAYKNDIHDGMLVEAVERAEKGLVDADLGGGVIKQRIARGMGKVSREDIVPSSFCAKEKGLFSLLGSRKMIGTIYAKTKKKT